MVPLKAQEGVAEVEKARPAEATVEIVGGVLQQQPKAEAKHSAPAQGGQAASGRQKNRASGRVERVFGWRRGLLRRGELQTVAAGCSEKNLEPKGVNGGGGSGIVRWYDLKWACCRRTCLLAPFASGGGCKIAPR
jgi:hypothetical protein